MSAAAQGAAVRFVQPGELSRMLLAGRRVAVVDVREEDRAGGHVRGSISEPKQHFASRVDGLVKRLAAEPLVVFHCQMSQVRGPYCAAVFAARLPEDAGCEVAVLYGGFTGFVSHWRAVRGESPAHEALVESFSEEHWPER